MKKIFSILFATALVSAVVGCSGEKDSTISGPRMSDRLNPEDLEDIVKGSSTTQPTTPSSQEEDEIIAEYCDNFTEVERDGNETEYYCLDNSAFYICTKTSCTKEY